MIKKIFAYIVSQLKKPFCRIYFYLRWEIFRKPPYATNYYGFKLFYKRGDSLISRIKNGEKFENDIIQNILKTIKPDSAIFDVGANLGLITLALAKQIPGCSFHCFEPSPYPYEYFHKTISENKLGDRIKLNKTALSSKDGQISFYVHDYKDASGDGVKDTKRAGLTKKIIVKAQKLDTYVKSNKINKLDFIKIDTEGNELNILENSTISIKKFKPVILFEANLTNMIANSVLPQDIYRCFDRLGYTINTIEGKKLKLDMFIKTLGKEENFLAKPNTF